jgi:hypothetical protein
MARQGRLQSMHIRRERLLDDRWRHGLFPQAVGLFEDPGEIMFNLQRRAEPLGQHVQGRRGQDVQGVHGPRTWVRQPGDITALLALNPLEFKDRGPRPGLFTRRPAQVIFEPRMAGSH